MDFEQALGELGLELYSDEEALIEVAEAGEEGRKSITFSASTAVKVLLKVPGAQGVVNRYDLAAEIQSPPCQDDEAEDDDGPEQARSASPGDIIEGAVCAGDEDWFAFVLPADVVFAPSLSFSHLDGDLLLELFSADGETLLASSDTLTDEESIEHLVALPGLHHLKVSGNGRAQGAYVLEAAGGGDSRCPGDDAQEDNDDFESPALIEPGRQGDLIMCQGDEDWYRFELEEGQSAEVFVLAAAESGVLNVALFGPAALSDGDDPVDEALGEGVVKRVRVQAGTPAGAYLLRVVGAREDDVPYSVRLDVYEGPLPLGCEFDDAFEDNDLVSDAVRLEGRQTHDGILCGEDVDWFRFDAEVGDIVSVRVDFLHEEGDLNLTLHGGTPLVPLAQSLSADDGEFLQHRVEQAGPLFAELALGSGESAVYALTISSIRGSLPQSCVTDDLFEQNDGFDTATEVDAGSITAIHCSEDDDFFSVSLLAGQTLRARLMHEGEEGLELALYEGVDQPVAQAEALGSAIKVLEFTAEQGLDGALGVSSGLPRDAAYTLTFEILDAVPQRCGEEDANEPDDDPGVATAVTESSEFGEQTLCGADEDWYEITLPAGHRLVAEVRFDPLLGNLESEVYDQLGGGLGASYSTSDVERLELGSVNVERQVFLRTFLADEGEVSSLDYTLAITIENDELCSPDVNEDNNTSRTATRISRGNQDGLSICGEDEDWFLINLNQPLSTVVVTIEFDGEAADLDLVLYQESLMFELARSSGVGDREVIMETVVFPGPHLIQVFRFDGGSTDYSLRVTVR
jgi:hypothetical protein